MCNPNTIRGVFGGGDKDGLDQLANDARYWTTDQDGRGGGRVADAYADAANQGASITLPNSSAPDRVAMTAGQWRDELVRRQKANRTSNPFQPSEAQIDAAYPPSGISPDHRLVYPRGR